MPQFEEVNKYKCHLNLLTFPYQSFCSWLQHINTSSFVYHTSLDTHSPSVIIVVHTCQTSFIT